MLGGVTGSNNMVEVNSICGLRDNAGKSYASFCENFLQCVCPDDDWKRYSRNTRVSEFVDTSLEAFGVVTYINGYDVWKKRYRGIVTVDGDVSSVTNEDDKSNGSEGTIFKFTANARGSRKYSGWSAEGVKLYNEVLEILTEQRKKETSGRIFDNKVMDKLSMKRKRKNENQGNNDTPRARNNLGKLMRASNIITAL